VSAEQLPLFFEGARARKTDPNSSHRAAFDAERFARSHAGQIVSAVVRYPGRTANQLSVLPGCPLTVVQIDRRAHELEADGWLIRTAHPGDELRLHATRKASEWANRKVANGTETCPGLDAKRLSRH